MLGAMYDRLGPTARMQKARQGLVRGICKEGMRTRVEAGVDEAQGGGAPGGGDACGHEVGHGWQHHPLPKAHCSPGQQHSRQCPAPSDHLHAGAASPLRLVPACAMSQAGFRVD